MKNYKEELLELKDSVELVQFHMIWGRSSEKIIKLLECSADDMVGLGMREVIKFRKFKKNWWNFIKNITKTIFIGCVVYSFTFLTHPNMLFKKERFKLANAFLLKRLPSYETIVVNEDFKADVMLVLGKFGKVYIGFSSYNFVEYKEEI